MKKLALILLCLAVFASMAMAQSYVQGTGLVGMDKLGAHQNGGRGCAGCHAPHSGGLGGGGNAALNAAAFNDPTSGSTALWGQDLTPLYSKTLLFGSGGEFAETLPANQDSTKTDLTGVAFCLSCHDGQVAKGGMMTGVSYEQAQQELPAGVYGPNPIPTLLGNDGTVAGNYKNDHPVGPAANLTAVNVAKWWTLNGTTLSLNTAQTNYSTQYGAFVSAYGTPSFKGRGTIACDGAATAGDCYLVCTSCHTPHTMYTFTASSTNPMASATSGTFPTYFFLVGPYNPASKPAKNQASSATQFCRQCHFSGAGGANESVGIQGVTTAF